MKKIIIGIAAVVIVLVAVSASAKPDAPVAVAQATPSAVTADATAEPTSAAPSASPTAEPTAAVSYKPITFTVTAEKTTKPFYIGTNVATLSIRNKGGCDMLFSGAYLYPKGETLGFVGALTAVQDCEPHETEIYLDGPGDYYLKIGVANTTTTVTITPHD